MNPIESLESLVRHLELARLNAYAILADQIAREKPEAGLRPGDPLPKSNHVRLEPDVHLLLYPELPPLKSRIAKSDAWYRTSVRDRIVRSILAAMTGPTEPIDPATVLFVYRLPKNLTWPDPDNLERKPILDALRYAGLIRDDRLGRLTLIESAAESTVPYTAVFVLATEKTPRFLSEIETYLETADRHIQPVLPESNSEAVCSPDPERLSGANTDRAESKDFW